jgi:uncharacterized membrane protein
MDWKPVGLVLIVVGAIGLVLSLTANLLGIGSDPSNFGWLQILGTVLGVVIVAVGLWLSLRKPAPKKKK